MRLSIVTTMYMSEPYVLEFYRRARAAADKITPDVEIIFVDDARRTQRSSRPSRCSTATPVFG